MTVPDFITMLYNLGQSLTQVIYLFKGMAYLLGMILILLAIGKMRLIADSRTGSHSQEKSFTPLAYFLTGAALLFLPQSITILSMSTFGTGGILALPTAGPSNILNVITMLIQLTGFIWFLRGCVLLAQASEPGGKHGSKGLAFLVGGLMALKANDTLSMIQGIFSKLQSLMNGA
jgi:hypothetical protein